MPTAAQAGSTAVPVAPLDGTSAAEPPARVNVSVASLHPLHPLRQASWHSGRVAARPKARGAACARASHRNPPHQPPSPCEGDWWGDLQAVGREAGSPLRLLKTTPPIPNPFP